MLDKNGYVNPFVAAVQRRAGSFVQFQAAAPCDLHETPRRGH